MGADSHPHGPCKNPFAVAARRFNGLPFLVSGTETFSFAEFHRRAMVHAVELAAQGIGPGCRVALSATSSPETLLTLDALWHLGASPCLLDPNAPAEYQEARAAEAGCAELFNGTSPSFPRKRESKTQGRCPASGSLDSRVRGNDGEEAVPPAHEWLPGQPALLLFTSGTGGAPKAVCHSLCGIQHSAHVTAVALDLAPGDRWLLTLPLHHVSGLSIVMRCLAVGAACILSSRETPLAEQILRHAPTHLSLVATQLRRLLEAPESRESLSRLKTLLLGGGPSPVELLHRALDAGIPVRNSYGMTETFALVCLSRRNEPPEETASAGLPLEPGTVFITEDSRIALRGPRLFLGYWRNGALDPSRTPNGAFLTNDTGRMDPQGRLTVTGRTDTMFISGGENIHPEEIEAALLRLPEILAAVVVPVAHPEFGAVPAAFLQTADGVLPELAALREALARMLPRHALPRHLLPWPGTESAGIKADRSQWRKKAESALGISTSENR